MTPTFKKEHAYILLRDKILRGELPDGCRLPTETQLAGELGIGRVTLRSALENLEQNHLIRRVRGQGTFVSYSGPEKAMKLVPSRIDEPPLPRNLKHKFLVISSSTQDQSSSGTPILAGIEARANELKIELLHLQLEILRHSFNAERIVELSKQFLTGVLLTTHNYCGDEPELELLRQLNLPTILPFGCDTDATIEPFIIFDPPSRPAIFSALRYLRERGHRLIAFIGPFGERHLYGLSPYEYQVMTDWEAPLFATAAETPDSVIGAIRTLLQQCHPTAILSYNSHYASLVLEALNRLNQRVPEDISLVAFGNAPGCAFLNPPLTSVSFRLKERGIKAVDYLVSGGVGRLSPPHIGFEIIERASVKNILPSNLGS